MNSAKLASQTRNAKPPRARRKAGVAITLETALREAEERYLTLFNHAPVGIGISTMSGKVLAFNRHLCDMAGMTEAEALASSARAFYLHARDRSRLIKLLRQTGQVREEKVLFRIKNGPPKLCVVSIQVIRLGRRKVLLNIIQDITQRDRTERHLQGLVELLRLLVTRSSRKTYLGAVVRLLRKWCGCRAVGIRLLESDRRAPYAAHVGFPAGFVARENRESCHSSHCACLRMLAGHPRPNDARRIQASFFCDSANRFAREIQRGNDPAHRIACVQSGYHSLAHAPIRHAGRIIGTIHLADPRPARLGPEIISYIESAASLVGEAIQRFAAEESLQESEARFRALFERHHGVMLLLDPRHGTVVDANPAAQEFYGHPLDQLQRIRFQDLATLPDAAAAKLKELLRRDQKSFGVQQRLASGQTRLMEVHASSIEMRGHRLVFCLLEDVTERKGLEKRVLTVAERERQRIGQDLHDSVGGKLGGAAMIAQALAQRLRNRGLEDASLADEVVQCLGESIAQTRSIARGLCPVEWTAGGLASALAEMAREKQRHSGIPVHFVSHTEVQAADAFAASHLFFIAQEAVNNALRHACAQKIVIRLQNRRSGLVLDVEDDGVGMPTQSGSSEGLGLRSMNYRADLLGASLIFKARQNGGTCVRCLLPRSRSNGLPARKGI
jgi:PAS domain S-box-containing protein